MGVYDKCSRACEAVQSSVLSWPTAATAPAAVTHAPDTAQPEVIRAIVLVRSPHLLAWTAAHAPSHRPPIASATPAR